MILNLIVLDVIDNVLYVFESENIILANSRAFETESRNVGFACFAILNK